MYVYLMICFAATSEGSTEQSSSEGSTIEQSTDLTESTSEVSTETEDGYTESSTSKTHSLIPFFQTIPLSL